MKNYDLTTRKKTYCIKHQKHCEPITGSWILKQDGWECSEVNISFPEMVPQKFHEERRIYANDMLQSHRGGQLSREFLEAHPQRAKQMLRDKAITKEDVKSSKYVWNKDVKGVTKKMDAEALIK